MNVNPEQRIGRQHQASFTGGSEIKQTADLFIAAHHMGSYTLSSALTWRLRALELVLA